MAKHFRSQLFFSGGNIRAYHGEKGITRYYFSTRDTIFHQHLIVELVDFNYRKKWKLMKTEDNKFIRIQEINRSSIEVSGPVPGRKICTIIPESIFNYQIIPLINPLTTIYFVACNNCLKDREEPDLFFGTFKIHENNKLCYHY